MEVWMNNVARLGPGVGKVFTPSAMEEMGDEPGLDLTGSKEAGSRGQVIGSRHYHCKFQNTCYEIVTNWLANSKPTLRQAILSNQT